MAYDGALASREIRRFAEQQGLSYARSARFTWARGTFTRGGVIPGSVVGGQLPGGVEGLVGDYGVRRKQQDKMIERHSLVLLTRAPEVSRFITRLLCRSRADDERGLLSIIAEHYGLLGRYRTIELESLAFNTRYRVSFLENQDENWIQQLFDPVFVDWLSQDDTSGYFFELVGGVLAVYSQEEPGTEGSLERICAFAARVSARMREEAAEQRGLPVLAAGSGPGVATSADASPDRAERRRPHVTFDTPPPDVRSATKPFRRFARRRLSAVLFPLLLALFVFLLPGLLLAGLAHGMGASPSISLAIGCGVVLAGALWFVPILYLSIVGNQATRWGLDAFLDAYRTDNGLDRCEVQQFLGEHPRLLLPMLPAQVLAGPLPGAPGRASLVVSLARGGRRGPSGMLTGVVSLPPPADLPATCIWARDTIKDAALIGGFLVTNVTGLARRSAYDAAVLDDRLTSRFDVLIDDGGEPGRVQALFSGPLVSWLLARTADAQLSISLNGTDLVLFTQSTNVQSWSTATFNEFRQSLSEASSLAAQEAGGQHDGVRAGEHADPGAYSSTKMST